MRRKGVLAAALILACTGGVLNVVGPAQASVQLTQYCYISGSGTADSSPIGTQIGTLEIVHYHGQGYANCTGNRAKSGFFTIPGQLHEGPGCPNGTVPFETTLPDGDYLLTAIGDTGLDTEVGKIEVNPYLTRNWMDGEDTVKGGPHKNFPVVIKISVTPLLGECPNGPFSFHGTITD